MQLPRLEVYLNASQELTVAHFREADREALLVDIKLGDLIEDGFESATRKLGDIMLRTLMLWHRDVFDRYADFKSVGKSVISDFELADLLIAKSITSKTSRHIKSIEHLLNRAETGGTE